MRQSNLKLFVSMLLFIVMGLWFFQTEANEEPAEPDDQIPQEPQEVVLLNGEICEPNNWRMETVLNSDFASQIQAEIESVSVEPVVRVYGIMEKNDCGFSKPIGQEVNILLASEINQPIIEFVNLFASKLNFDSKSVDTIRITYLTDSSSLTLKFNPTEGVYVDASQVLFKPDDQAETSENSISQGLPKHKPKVMIVSYNPLLSNGQLLSEYMGWFDHAQLTQQTINFFLATSNGQLQYQIQEVIQVTDTWPVKTNGFQYTEQTYFEALNDEANAENTGVDYNAILNDPNLDICSKVNQYEVDEVWIYNAPWFGFYEATLVGPDKYNYINNNSSYEPHDCERLFAIMGPSAHVSSDFALHNFGHRAESGMNRANLNGWNFYPGTEPDLSNDWSKFALVEVKSTFADYSGCGDIHYPPNSLAEYDYDAPGDALTNCDDFFNFPNLADPPNKLNINCSHWGCNQYGYLAYWFDHLPSFPDCSQESIANDWWGLFIWPQSANVPDYACSSSNAITTTVDAELGWQPVNFYAEADNEYFFNVSYGLWTSWFGSLPFNTGEGGDYFCTINTCQEPLPNFNTGALIGRVGDHIFPIGNNRILTLPDSGQLFLRMNDQDAGLFDNRGTLTVSIKPTSPILIGQGQYYVSSTSSGTVDGVTFTDEDILIWDSATGVWDRYFDGSDVGLAGDPFRDVDAFALLDDGSLLLSIAGDTTIPDVGAVDDSDIIRFVPTKIGRKTEGSFQMYFDGSDVGLTTNAEDIDGLSILDDGRIVISTLGAAQVQKQFGNQMTALDEDLIVFTPLTLGDSTSGYFDFYFDGSDIGLDTPIEDVWAVSVEGSDLYLSAADGFSLPSLSGDASDTFSCIGATLGTNSSCSETAIEFDGGSLNIATERIDAIQVDTDSGN
ncbi:MAG: hypothetical protein AAF902_09605 [Chloroflexota bacterium]